jgi:hypothetical protein
MRRNRPALRSGGHAAGTHARVDAVREAEDQGQARFGVAREWHGRLMSWYRDERDRQSVNRYQMAVDEDFYDGLQWTQEDAQELMARGQAPLVFNKVKPTVNWLLGTEKRTRFDYKILPREESDEVGAEVKTKLFKYISDVNNLPFQRSAAFKEQIAAGLSWLEEGITTDPGRRTDLRGPRELAQRAARQLARRLDIKDARYQYRWRWLDLDIAMRLVPDTREHPSLGFDGCR